MVPLQMHIHVAKLRPDVRKALVTSAWGKTPVTTFISIPNPVAGGHPLRAIFIEVACCVTALPVAHFVLP